MILLLPVLYSLFVFALVVSPIVSYISNQFFPNFQLEPVKVSLIDPDSTKAKYQIIDVSIENLNFTFEDQILESKNFVTKSNLTYSTLGYESVIEVTKKQKNINH